MHCRQLRELARDWLGSCLMLLAELLLLRLPSSSSSSWYTDSGTLGSARARPAISSVYYAHALNLVLRSASIVRGFKLGSWLFSECKSRYEFMYV
jgi:hypothetical protein